ncbi:MAG: toll/interleukin-1 receptor domain-containing protein [Burkholderiales bacterium]
MPQPQIFISYRRDDAAGYARALYDELARRFGAARVFMDVDDIDAGAAFADVIRHAVGESKVLLVLIGRRWLGEREGQPPRIADPGDFVRMEVAAGLAKGMRVIPLLLDGAPMPQAAQLPDELRPLVGRNALELDNSRFVADTARLIAAVREALGEPGEAPLPAVKPSLRSAASAWPRRAIVAIAVLAAGGLGLTWLAREPARPPAGTIAPVAPAPVVRVAVDGEWQATVEYDWPNARYAERFVLAGEGAALHGSASFLGVPRGLLEGVVDADGVRFVTRTQESGGGDAVHRYRGRRVGDELRFVMQTEGGNSPHVPVAFVARRLPAAASAASR